MDGIWTASPRDLDTRAKTEGILPTSFTMSESFDEALTGSATGLLFNLGYDTAARLTEPKVSKQDAEERIKTEGLKLTVPEGGYTQTQLDRAIERKKDENARRYALSLSEGFGQKSAEFAAGIAGALVDPLNVATAFIPVVGEARYLQMLKGAASPVGRAGVRAGVGAVEGFAGSLMLEPGVYAARRYFQDEYTVADSLMNVLFGTAMGAGLHAGGGAIADVYRSSKGMDQPWATKNVEDVIRQAETDVRLEMETHDTAIRHAMNADLEGKVSNPSAIIESMEPSLKGQIDEVSDAARIVDETEVGAGRTADISGIRSAVESSQPKGIDPVVSREADNVINEYKSKTVADIMNEEIADLQVQARSMEKQLGIEGSLDEIMREADIQTKDVQSMIDAVEVAAICRIRT